MDDTLQLARRDVVPPFGVAGASHPGLVAEENEDSWMADAPLGLAIAADGVGGHEDGGAASRDAVATIAAHLRAVAALGLTPDSEAQARLSRENHVRRAIAAAHERLAAANAARNGKGRSSGTTVAGVWAPFGAASFATVFHVGDSRVYRLRGGRLCQLTRDHSAYEQWRQNGQVGAPPPHKYILQALGVSQRVKPDIHSFLPEPGDRLLICTDGVCGGVETAEIEPLLAGHAAPHMACGALVDFALARGGRDNATAVVCELHN